MLKKTLDILGWIGTALVGAGVIIRFARPAIELPLGPAGRPFLWTALLWAGLALVLLYILSQWREIGRMFAGRQARFGSLSIASLLIVLGILGAANWVASRENKRWDLTTSKQFSVSDQTRKILQSLKTPVKVLVFAKEDDFERFRDRLREYEYVSKNVQVQFIDVDKKPALARQYQVQSYGTVVFEYQTRVERVTADSEQELTNTLIKAVEGQQKKVYFVQGHGEKDTGSAERDGYNQVAAKLANENFAVEKLVLLQHKEVPGEATALVVAGPQADFYPAEIDMLRRWLRKGGKAFFLIDPPAKPDSPPLTNLAALVRESAVDLGNDVVVDVSGIGQLIGTDASVPVAANYPSHAITDRFNLLTAFPFARSVNPVSGGVDGRFAQTFVETSPRSWAETDIRTLSTSGKVALETDKGDKQGPVSIGAAMSTTAPDTPAAKPAAEGAPADERKPEMRVAVIGDSDFAANSGLGIQGNLDLFLNTLNWLAQKENLISIRPREPDDRRITLTADQQRRIMWLSLVLIPGLVLATGVYTWWRRR